MQSTGFEVILLVAIGFAVLLVVSLVLNIVALCKLKKLSRKCDRFTRGKDAESLEDTIYECLDRVDNVERVLDIEKGDISVLRKNLRPAIQKVGLVKYDAFFDLSGKLSYAVAMLDQNNNGFIINSVYARDMNYSYMKEIVDGVCALELSGEEQEALEKAKNKA